MGVHFSDPLVKYVEDFSVLFEWLDIVCCSSRDIGSAKVDKTVNEVELSLNLYEFVI